MLTSCAAHLSPPAAEPVQPVKPRACDPRLETRVPDIPVQPQGATVVEPVTPAEKLATALHLDWVAAVLDVAGQLRERSLAAKSECEARR